MRTIKDSRANPALNVGTTLSVLSLLIFVLLLAPAPAPAASESFSEKVSSAADQTKEALNETSKAALTKIEQLWQKVDSQRLKNRTWDEIVAWAIMGLLAGGVLGQFMKMNRAGALALGLLGSFLGGIVVHLAEIDLGLGPVLIRYEDLLFAFVGSLLALLVLRSLMKRKQPKT